MEFTRGETVEWIMEDRSQLRLRRLQPPPAPEKNARTLRRSKWAGGAEAASEREREERSGRREAGERGSSVLRGSILRLPGLKRASATS